MISWVERSTRLDPQGHQTVEEAGRIRIRHQDGEEYFVLRGGTPVLTAEGVFWDHPVVACREMN